MATPKKKVTGKKSASLGESRAASIAKDARNKASGSREVIFEKPRKPKKDLNSADYQGLTKEQRNSKYYNSEADSKNGKMTETLKNLKKIKTKNLTNKEAKGFTEDSTAKGKNYTKATVSNVNEEAYQRVMKRAAASGLSAKDAKKAIDGAIRTISGNLQTDRSRTASRAEGIAKRELKKKQDKITRGY
jgi:hypothetical protein